MKLKTLAIKNIASIEDAVIEFDKGALAADPLFLITGRTGAGKTTILNAICLALYDEVPCLTDIQDDRTRKDDDIKISSPLQLMRKGSKTAEVTLTFECADVEYTAVWEAHYSRIEKDGHRNLIHTRSLVNNATGKTYAKISEIDSQIREAVGLTFEQFTRTTMLAQGQFAAFMRADEKDKADILEKLTGTEIYTRIGRQVYELTKEAEILHARLSSDISEIKLLSEEEISEIEEKKIALTVESIAASLKIAAIDRQLEWLRVYGNLQKSLEQAQSDFDRLAAIAGSVSHKEKIAAIEGYDSTVDIRTQIRRCGEIQKQIAGLSADLDAYRKDKACEIADGLCHIEKEIAAAQDRHQTLTAEQKEMEPMAGVYADIQRIEEKASQLVALIGRRSDTEANVKKTEKELAKSRRAELPIRESIDATDKKTAEFDSLLRDIDSKLADYDRPALTSEKSAVDSEILRLKRIVQLLETLYSRLRDLEETRRRVLENAGNRESAKKKFAEIEIRIPQLATDYEKCRAFFDGQKTLADHINQLRTLYAESDKCPLCGNPHAEMPADEVINDVLEEAKKKADEANRVLVDAKARHKSLKTEIATLGKRADELIEEEERKRNLVDSTISELNAAGCTDPDEAMVENLRKACAGLEKKSMDYEKVIGEVDSLMAQREAEARKREINIVNREKAVKKLHKQQQETIRFTEKLDQQQESLKGLNKDIEDSLGQLSEMTGTQITIELFGTVVEGLKKESGHYSRLKESLSQCEKEIAYSIKVLSNCKDLIPEALRVYIERYSPRPKALVNPEVKISEYGNVVSRMSGEITTCENQLAEIKMQIDSFFDAAAITREEVDEIAGIREDTVRQWRAEVKDVAERLTRAEGALTAINAQIADHNEAKPEMPEDAKIDSLSSEKELMEKTRDTAKEAKTHQDNLLKENERLRKTYEDRIRQREEAAVQYNEWSLLNNVFGSSNGARFRAIAQSYVLRALLVRANGYLSWLSSRYTLDCKDGSLSIDVIDQLHGNTVRNVSSLSGGEGFVVSLALALGLSAISKDKIDVDILFIDEGFGSLDHDMLETVIETLDSLHRRGGRRIGIISHIAQIAERIPTQIRLVSAGPSLSRVVIV